MFRFLLILGCVCSFISLPSFAASFSGRGYQIFDGRIAAKPAALVLVLHGAGGSGRQIRKSSGFDALARANGFVVVYPSAPFRVWNDGRFSPTNRPHINKRNDVAWLTGLVASLADKGMIDPARVFALGHSNGGAMVRRLHCDNPDLLSGLVIVSTKVLKAVKCKHSKPIATALFYGTKDKIAPHNGRKNETAILRNAGETFSGNQSVDIWRRQNKCRRSIDVSRYNPDKTDQTRIVEHRYISCRAPLIYYEMVGGGHAYPGATDVKRRAVVKLIGAPINDIDAGEEALKLWRF